MILRYPVHQDFGKTGIVSGFSPPESLVLGLGGTPVQMLTVGEKTFQIQIQMSAAQETNEVLHVRMYESFMLRIAFRLLSRPSSLVIAAMSFPLSP